MIPFGKDFFSEPRALGGSFIWVVVYSNTSLDLRYCIKGPPISVLDLKDFLELVHHL